MFCPKCGNSIPDGVRFCPKCGNPIKKAEPAVPPGPQAKTSANQSSPPRVGQAPFQKKKGYLMFEDGVCPNCGSHNCEIQVQQNVTGSGSNYSCCNGALGTVCMGPFGLLCGLCGTGSKTTTTHKSMWVCKDCGNQFPTKQDRFSQFVATEAMLNGFLMLSAVGIFFFVGLGIPQMGFALLAIEVLFLCLDLKIQRDALGSFPEYTEEDVASGRLKEWELKLYLAIKPLYAVFPRSMTKDIVTDGILTEQQRKTYLVTTITSLLVSLAVGIILLIAVF